MFSFMFSHLCNLTVLCQILAKLCDILHTDSLGEVLQWLLHASTKGEIKINICRYRAQVIVRNWESAKILEFWNNVALLFPTVSASESCSPIYPTICMQVIQWTQNTACLKLNSLEWCELLYLCPKEALFWTGARCTSPPDSTQPGSSLSASYGLFWTSNTEPISFLWMAVTQPSRFQILTTLPSISKTINSVISPPPSESSRLAHEYTCHPKQDNHKWHTYTQTELDIGHCTSNKVPGDAGNAILGTPLWESLH